ncbi:10627_t:CDS:2 [Paraglomus occultum]|uniref:Elongator complex protein 5 n=1 Tax=Paraglomus occultum TaxID=144539 RepID=A0A9N9FM75_9GLOM|nr:10627_t:CDS:2 [Paraglomus occultum]
MASLLLDRILSNKEFSPFITIEDTIQQTANVIVREFIKRAGAKESAKRLHSSSFVIIDAYSRVNLYDDNDSSPSINSDINTIMVDDIDDINHLATLIQDTLVKLKTSTFTLFIDSLTPLLQRSTSATFNLLKKVSNKFSDNGRMVVTYHSDIPIPSSIFNIGNTLSHMATASILVNNTEIFKKRSRGFIEVVNEEGLSDYVNSLDNGVCIIRLKKKSGRIQHETNTYQLDELTGTFNISLVHDLKVQDESTEPDPTTANLLFNLRITEEQKKARDEVVLPYVKIHEKSEPIAESDI